MGSIPVWAYIVAGVAILLAGSLGFLGGKKGNLGILDTIDRFRNIFSFFVFLVATGGIWVLVITSVSPTASYVSPHEAFTALLPVFTTWVGTILAHYFSRENFESARSSLQDVVNKLAPDKSGTTKLADAIATGQGAVSPKIQVASAAAADALPLDQVVASIKSVPNASRVLIVDPTDTPLYIVYQSSVADYLTGGGQPTQPLSTFLSAPLSGTTGQTLSTRFVLMNQDKTLAEAKAALAGNIRDVLVTRSNPPSGPVVGWFTDTQLAKL